ncbi:MAG: DUF72 domain-containing protein [Cyanobacteria bacterium P01_F01_bin.150]
MGFSLGCAIWAYKEWIGDLYPSGSKASEFLRLYSRRFTTVEGNTTFYSVPSASMVQRWHHETPASFKFCLKLPQTITHQGPLMPNFDAAMAFLDRVSPLGDRLGPFLIQLPPSYGTQYFEDLTAFLQRFPRHQFRLSVEVRHPDWFKMPHANRLNYALTELGVGRALLDSRPIYDCKDDPQVRSERRKPNLPLQPITTAPFSLIRYISHPVLENNQRYLNEWVAHVTQWYAQGIDLYFFVHCPIEARSPQIARYFQDQLNRTEIGIPALPWNGLEQHPSQLSLF